MARPPLYNRAVIYTLLFLQVIPLLMFPLGVYRGGSQMWWLPALLVLMVLAADLQLLLRPSTSPAPWYLLAFAQGINVISRLMMFWANSSTVVGGATIMDWGYVLWNALAIVLSAAYLVYMEKPDVREGVLRA